MGQEPDSGSSAIGLDKDTRKILQPFLNFLVVTIAEAEGQRGRQGMGEPTNAFEKNADRSRKQGSSKRGFDTLRLTGSKLVAVQRFEWLHEQAQGATTSSVDWGAVRVDGSRMTGGFYGKQNHYATAMEKLYDAWKYKGGTTRTIVGT